MFSFFLRSTFFLPAALWPRRVTENHLHTNVETPSVLCAALSLAPEEAQQPPWLSPVLVFPVLQLLSCSGLTEPLADLRTHRLTQGLAERLLRSISRPTGGPPQVHETVYMQRGIIVCSVGCLVPLLFCSVCLDHENVEWRYCYCSECNHSRISALTEASGSNFLSHLASSKFPFLGPFSLSWFF